MSGLQRSGHFTSDFKLRIRVQAASSLEPQKAECNFPLLFYMCSNTLLTPVNRLSCVNLVEFPFKFFFFFQRGLRVPSVTTLTKNVTTSYPQTSAHFISLHTVSKTTYGVSFQRFTTVGYNKLKGAVYAPSTSQSVWTSQQEQQRRRSSSSRRKETVPLRWPEQWGGW